MCISHSAFFRSKPFHGPSFHLWATKRDRSFGYAATVTGPLQGRNSRVEQAQLTTTPRSRQLHLHWGSSPPCLTRGRWGTRSLLLARSCITGPPRSDLVMELFWWQWCYGELLWKKDVPGGVLPIWALGLPAISFASVYLVDGMWWHRTFDVSIWEKTKSFRSLLADATIFRHRFKIIQGP